MPSVHAMLGPSSAHRWIACPPSARLEADIPNKTSVFSEEGTRAHSLCEVKLDYLNKCATTNDVESVADSVGADADMWRFTESYKDFVEEELNAARAADSTAVLMVEQQLEFEEYVPEGFGTSDAVIVSDSILEVIDFKYGKGVPVSATENPQLRLYALGTYLALSPLYDFDTVKIVVYQPRIDNVSSETLPVSELIEWAETVVKPAAQLAYKGEGEFKVGEHCRFCRAGSLCRARAEEAFKVIEASASKPALLTNEEIAPLLDKLDNTKDWIEAIKAYAHEQAVSYGYKWPGYKLVEGKTNRKIVDPIKAAEKLKGMGYSEEDYLAVKLKSITELERLVSKATFVKEFKDLIVKPQGEPNLVKESDKRPEINPLENIFKEEI